MRTGPSEDSFSVPVRRSLMRSFMLGVAAAIVSLLSAALLGSLLLLSNLDGAVLITLCFSLWLGLFLLSYPLQRRLSRTLDSRRPGVTLADGLITVPIPGGAPLHLSLAEPLELKFGWWEYAVKSTGGPTSNTRTVLTHAALTQGGTRLFFRAEDSIRKALDAGWRKSPPPEISGHTAVRLWASDLVALVDVIARQGTKPARQ